MEDNEAYQDGDLEFMENPRRKSSTAHPIDAVVTTLDGSEHVVPCLGGRYTIAEELRDKVAEQIGLPSEERTHFAIWVVSASLQLQMKLHHLPFKVMKKWPEILESYTTVDPDSELPMLYFRKDAFLYQDIEKEIIHPTAIDLLFHEATFNILYSLYPVEEDDATYLASIHLQLHKGKKCSKKDILEIEGCFMPEHLRSSVKVKTWQKKILHAREEKLAGVTNKLDLHLLYLKHCRQWSYYGSTFFTGEVEPPADATIFQETPDEVVRVGVNIDGIHVISDKKNTVKLSLPFNELTYNSYDDSESGDTCFLIEYNHQNEDGGPPDKLVIWTPQASMLDTLVTRFVAELPKHEDYRAGRMKARGYSIKPKRNAMGRADGAGGGALDRAKHFTLSKFAMKSLRKKKGGDVPRGAAGPATAEHQM